MFLESLLFAGVIGDDGTSTNPPKTPRGSSTNVDTYNGSSSTTEVVDKGNPVASSGIKIYETLWIADKIFIGLVVCLSVGLLIFALVRYLYGQVDKEGNQTKMSKKQFIQILVWCVILIGLVTIFSTLLNLLVLGQNKGIAVWYNNVDKETSSKTVMRLYELAQKTPPPAHIIRSSLGINY